MNDEDDGDVDTESLDISTAFLQGLGYDNLREKARTLGYEYREDRTVYIIPPENVWSHFRRMPEASRSWKIPDKDRHRYALKCLRAMYGFTDASLMFQLALLEFLKDKTGAKSSVFDDNYLYWGIVYKGNKVIVLVMTVHADDLQITGSRFHRDWIHKKLESRFGKLKRQTMPYTHAGLQLERVVPTCIRINQDQFTSCLSQCVISKERVEVPDAPCTAAEQKTFRYLTC